MAWKNFNLWPQAPDDEDANDPRAIAEAKDHGTHVAAIVHGVAPEAKLIGLNVFSLGADGTYGSPAYDVLAALDWVAEHAAEQHIVAVNLSVGWEHSDAAPCNESVAFPAIQALWKQGVALVTATGNDATADWLNEPACASLAISVGAQYDTDMGSVANCEPGYLEAGDLACLSNLSGAVDLVAPGMHIDTAGKAKSGTSMAAPHVAGAIALQQSRWLAEKGALRSPAWAREQLIMDSLSRPHDGRVFHQLSLAEGPKWSAGALFPAFPRETAEGAIPVGPAVLEQKVQISGHGAGKVAGVYLHLEARPRSARSRRGDAHRTGRQEGDAHAPRGRAALQRRARQGLLPRRICRARRFIDGWRVAAAPIERRKRTARALPRRGAFPGRRRLRARLPGERLRR
ncbi:MAG: S8 family serine peptidase [Myxococcales bacterium]